MFGPSTLSLDTVPTLLRAEGVSSAPAIENRQAIALDGVDQTIRFFGATPAGSAFADVNSDNQFTFNIWFRIPDVDALPQVEVWNQGSTTIYNRLFLSGNGTVVNFNSVSASGLALFLAGPITISDNTWHMVTITATRSTNWSASVYLDGQAITLTTNFGFANGLETGGSIFLGKTLGSANYDEIDIDEISLFKTEISAADVLYMYNNLIDLTTWTDVGTGKLLWWYRLEGNTTDSAGNYSDGSALNDPIYLQASSDTLPYN